MKDASCDHGWPNPSMCRYCSAEAAQIAGPHADDREYADASESDAANWFAAEWRPIETAPKDGTRIWCWFPDYDAYVVHWGTNFFDHTDNWTLDSAESATLNYDEPTHWMELPGAPDHA